MKKSIVILLSILLACTILTSCGKAASKTIGKVTSVAKTKTEKALEKFFLKKKSSENELDALLLKRKTQKEELEAFIQKKNRGNIEPEQQTKNVEKEFQGEEVKETIEEKTIDIIGRGIRDRLARNLARKSRDLTDSLVQIKKESGEIEPNFPYALQMHFSKGTLGKQPIEMFFENINRNGNAYSVRGKFKTETSEESFYGMLTINSKTTSNLCPDNEMEINGIYDLYGKNNGHFVGNFTACGNDNKLSKANFNGDWIKYSNGKKTPCNFEL